VARVVAGHASWGDFTVRQAAIGTTAMLPTAYLSPLIDRTNLDMVTNALVISKGVLPDAAHVRGRATEPAAAVPARWAC
jgi:hypothetical protein